MQPLSDRVDIDRDVHILVLCCLLEPTQLNSLAASIRTQIGQVSTDVSSGLGVFVQPGQLGNLSAVGQWRR